jgi:tetratricopeptide (TPR) repeat protein
MDQDKVADDAMMFCAACGMEECDDITLKTCTACKSVRYCGVKCQRDHRLQHKRACKKRAAEFRDELLFKQPESSHLGDCPICMIPLPLDPEKSIMMSCCSKLICNGCDYANAERELNPRDAKCPFCRKVLPSEKEIEENVMKRIEANDPVAICQKGKKCHNKGDYSSAFEYYAKAAKLGNIEAHYHLSICYLLGHGVEKDEKKGVFHLEEASIGGLPFARYHLGRIEGRNGRIERSKKHLMIAAGQGHDNAIEALSRLYAIGTISQDVFAAALRAHQAAVDATKSPQREVAEEYYRSQGQNRC